MAETVFSLLNILPLPLWLGMLLFPRARFTERLVQAYWPYIALGALYALLLVGARSQRGRVSICPSTRSGKG